MLDLKSHLTCSYCSKIFKSPILLPCNHSICREHLFAREVVRENKIKCSECQQEFKVKDNEYGPNQTLNRFIGDRVFLSEEEIILKKKLEQSVREFFRFYNEFLQNNYFDLNQKN